MARLAPKLDTVRALFARSGNQCAFPGCTHLMINSKQQFVGQICHIEAAMPQGERFNADQSDEERRSYDNLLLLCYQHHIETDDVDEFTVEKLKRIKQSHESQFLKSDFKIDESALFRLTFEMEQYWEKIERLNTVEHSMQDLAFRVSTQNHYLPLFDAARDSINRLEELLNRLEVSNGKLEQDFYDFIAAYDVEASLFKEVPYYLNPFQLRSWEDFTLSKPNSLMQIRIDLLSIEVSYLEQYLKVNSTDITARDRFESAKVQLADLAQNALLYD
ncbi:hypothetical protein AB6919_003586 [Vibrio cholerae]|nr:hypothetical protein [Vibrio cholerae]EHD2282554.1 hypothetical protein [Vibrio cholerae]EJL6474582.1 hypothetical protein [Vibrio cholerae]EJL6488931.1 hypothetical protein [Vibrio cholerae]EJL6586685.1 hypothetical protein [Vibrio cholerae]